MNIVNEIIRKSGTLQPFNNYCNEFCCLKSPHMFAGVLLLRLLFESTLNSLLCHLVIRGVSGLGVYMRWFISTIIKCQMSVSTSPSPLLPIGILLCVLCSLVSDSLRPHGLWRSSHRRSFCQALPSTEFSRQYWSGLPFSHPGDLPDPGIQSASLVSPALAGGFLPTSTIWEASPIGIEYFIYEVEVETQI